MTDTDERARFDAWWTGEYGWHSIRAEWAETPSDAAWMAWRAQGEEIANLKGEVARLRADNEQLEKWNGEIAFNARLFADALKEIHRIVPKHIAGEIAFAALEGAND